MLVLVKLSISGEEFNRERSERGMLEREGFQRRVPEKEAPRKRIPWWNLTEKRPRESTQEEYGPSTQVYRAPEKLHQVAFSKMEKT
jgi:hypothetical protein